MRNKNSIPAMRQKEIYSLLKEQGIVQVKELAECLKVTEMTIRRDIEALEYKGLAERTHGGAILNDRIKNEPPIAQKCRVRQKEKEAIGRLAASLIEHGDTVFVNSGTTTLQFLRSVDIDSVKVVTNNPWAPLEVRSENIEILVTGGELRRESFSLIGDSACQMVRQVFGTKAIIGVDGLSVKHGITNPIQAEANLNRLMIEQTHGEVIIVADSSKVGKISNFLTAPISAITALVTDSGIAPEYLEEFKCLGIKVYIAEIEK
jgi:DeoR/GlpR family transcriptional regulator of sugar metabolism